VTSDGIARVHGMTNVQAEELVEYVVPLPTRPPALRASG
jgi:F0F1-type ATP synthase alpha subunit